MMRQTHQRGHGSDLGLIRHGPVGRQDYRAVVLLVLAPAVSAHRHDLLTRRYQI